LLLRGGVIFSRMMFAMAMLQELGATKMSEKSDALADVREMCLSCIRCSIGGCDVDGCISNVFSSMNVDSNVMVVGQNPGATEVQRGFPFVGPSGEFFDKAIKEVLGVGREAFYITNVVKCFSPGNRSPHDEEIKNCRSILDAEVAVVRPKLIITLGGPSLKAMTGLSGITKHRGDIQFSPRYSSSVLPLWHPSPLNMNSKEKRQQFFDDLKKVIPYLR
jgi:DNA polymerase